jgi:glycerophosphoryl diester phosphodiesterase
MEAGSWFSEEFTGEKIPLLEEIIDLANDAMKLNIELKMNGNEKLLAKKVIKIVHNKNFVDRCIITSFDFNEVNKVREIDRNIKIGYIFKNIPEDIDVFTANCEILSVSRKIVDREFVNKAKLFNKEIHVWTVDNPEEMEKLINLGVDNIITNRPDVLRSVLKKLSRNPFL